MWDITRGRRRIDRRMPGPLTRCSNLAARPVYYNISCLTRYSRAAVRGDGRARHTRHNAQPRSGLGPSRVAARAPRPPLTFKCFDLRG
jgi:hypothetical protein